MFDYLTCFSIQATTALAETTAIADFRSLTVFSAIYVVYCTEFKTIDFSLHNADFLKFLINSGKKELLKTFVKIKEQGKERERKSFRNL